MKIKIFAPLLLISLAACVADNEETATQFPADSAMQMPATGSANDLSSFEGARAGQAEMGIQRLGYELVRSQGLTSYWFNRSTGACAEIKTSNGRYSSVTMLPSGDC